jgi:hypothetical protein
MAHPIIGRCPFCDDTLEVTSLYCPSCDTSVSGRFRLGRFQDLTSEQLAFAEVFIRCEGKITRVESELGLSYPTVRNRLNELIQAMGYSVRDEPRMTPEERRTILDRLASGEISSEEAVHLLMSK